MGGMTEVRLSAGGVVLNGKGQVALVQHGHTAFWGFPKGHVDAGESALQAAQREIAEESGLDELELIEDLGAYERFKGTPEGGEDTSERKRIHMFLFRTQQSQLAPKDPGHPDAQWVALEHVRERLTDPKDKEFFSSVEARVRANFR